MAPEPTKPNPGQATPKQMAAAARAEAEAAERRRERLVRTVGAVVVLLVVVGLLSLGFFLGQDKDEATAPPQADPNAAIPAGVQSDTFGVPYGSGWTSDNAAKLPTLQLWEDFQCPACASLEEAAGADIKQVADDGLVKLLYRPTTFLDGAHPSSQNASARATSAWGCAIDAGSTGPYHSAVFANQPSTEGEGWTNEQLKGFGSEAGITEESQDAFGTCVDEGRYLPWSANSYEKFVSEGVSSTPTALLNGVAVENADLANPETLRQLISDATTK